MNQILVVDDEQGIRTVLKDVLEDEGYQVSTAEDGFQALNILKTDSMDTVILDVRLPNMGGIDVLKAIKKDHPDLEVIVISGHASVNLAVQAVKIGAFDFLEKPLSLEKTITVVANALKFDTLKKENRNLRQSLFIEDDMIGSSAPMQKVHQLIRQSAGSEARILILGENGTGKELVAKEIHRQSGHSDGPFVEVNCASIPETLIESELFGHEKGAFTDAVGRRKGKFEAAHQGTIFLDEIADMSLHTQAKVLRVIQEMKFERVGGEEAIQVDVRLISATNKNITEEVNAGRFREDLYFRINVIPIYVAPLRERTEDLEELLAYFMKKYKSASKNAPKTVSAKAMQVLARYPWPGNIRELKNFVERINIMTEEQLIIPETVRIFLGNMEGKETEVIFSAYDSMKLNQARDSFEKDFLVRKLQENQNNITQASKILGITPSSLHNKVKKYGIELKR
ncbi:MAG TPA: sigma-54-dependent Fis family transcriptional regulator [bacterium]|nr:sigma-54-dependent Fis family transcriptional regulator [bacterium]